MARINIIEINGKAFRLTDQQKQFCEEYVRCKFNGTTAALKSGYSQKNAKASASQLLTVADVSGYINELKSDISRAINISAIDIAMEYAKIGFSDIRKVFDSDGNLIKVGDIADDPAANIASVEVFEEFQGTGSDRQFIGTTKKIKFYDKVNALDKLAKMIGADGNKKSPSDDGDGKENEEIVVTIRKS